MVQFKKISADRKNATTCVPPRAQKCLRVGGKHNVMNALAAASAAYLLGVSGEAVGLGLATFTGAGRRFEYKGSFHGADVYDDYAHHPGELHALLEMAKTLPYKRIICAFQPHTYTRTKALFNDFVKELRVPDVVVLAEIYAAREQNDIGISSMDLSREIPGSVYCPTLDKVTAALARIACPGDLILTVGAGDIFKAGEKLLKERNKATWKSPRSITIPAPEGKLPARKRQRSTFWIPSASTMSA